MCSHYSCASVEDAKRRLLKFDSATLIREHISSMIQNTRDLLSQIKCRRHEKTTRIPLTLLNVTGSLARNPDFCGYHMDDGSRRLGPWADLMCIKAEAHRTEKTIKCVGRLLFAGGVRRTAPSNATLWIAIMSVIANSTPASTRFIDMGGTAVVALPDFARETATLIALYRGMVLTRAFDTKAIALQRTGRLGTYA
jgi:hypothetical protein